MPGFGVRASTQHTPGSVYWDAPCPGCGRMARWKAAWVPSTGGSQHTIRCSRCDDWTLRGQVARARRNSEE